MKLPATSWAVDLGLWTRLRRRLRRVNFGHWTAVMRPGPPEAGKLRLPSSGFRLRPGGTSGFVFDYAVTSRRDKSDYAVTSRRDKTPWQAGESRGVGTGCRMGGPEMPVAGNACRRKCRVVSTQRSPRKQREDRGTANGERQSLQRSGPRQGP